MKTNETKKCCTCNQCDDEFTECECEVELCCACHGHEWVVLDQGETHECRHCNAGITGDNY